MLKAGDVAPDFTVEAHTGEKVTLSELRGKRVLLWFYPMADTPG
jgi:thioredoxin-dependent peroxiredoxin